MRKYWLFFLRAEQFNETQLNYLSMYCPDNILEILCQRMDELRRLLFTKEQIVMLATVQNGNTLSNVLEHYNSFFMAFQSNPSNLYSWRDINQVLIKLVSDFRKPELEFILNNVSKFAAYQCNFSDFIEVLFTQDGLQKFQVLLMNLHKIREAYALGFTAEDILKIANHSAKNLQILFDKMLMVNVNHTLTTQYFIECLSTGKLSELLLITIEETLKSNQQQVSTWSVENEGVTHVGLDISNNPSNKKRKTDRELVDAGLTMLDAVLTGNYVPEFDSSEPTTTSVTAASRASSMQTQPVTTTPEVMTNRTSSIAPASVMPNFGEGVMLLTESDLETLEVDEQDNLYITKNGERIAVFPNNEFAQKGRSGAYRDMQFYIENDNCLGIISKKPETELGCYSSHFVGSVLKGSTIYNNKTRMGHTSRRSVQTELNLKTQKLCAIILEKIELFNKRKASKYNHMVTDRNKEIAEGSSIDNSGVRAPNTLVDAGLAMLDTILNDNYVPEFSFSEPTTERMITTVTTTQTGENKTPYIAREHKASRNTSASVPPNFGEGVMLLTESDLETLEADEQNNLYISKNGARIPVFPNHEFLSKPPSTSFKRMDFYIVGNDCLGVISKDPKKKLESNVTLKGGTISDQKLYSVPGAKLRYDAAHKMCEKILAKVKRKFLIQAEPRTNSVENPLPPVDGAPNTSINNPSYPHHLGIFNHEGESGAVPSNIQRNEPRR